MKISELKNAPQWLLDADTLNADVVLNGDIIQWCDGVWWDGVWRGGEWCGGEWRGGVWCDGVWCDGVWCDGVWRGGVWRGGEWRGGEWCDGVWCGGEWRGGVWRGEKLSTHPLSLFGLRWPVCISETRLQIGCELHTFADWASFDDARIVAMDRGALKFWRENKNALLALCATKAA